MRGLKGDVVMSEAKILPMVWYCWGKWVRGMNWGSGPKSRCGPRPRATAWGPNGFYQGACARWVSPAAGGGIFRA